MILVGGGSIVVGEHITGVGKIMRPTYLEVANAVGAAVGQSNAPFSHNSNISRLAKSAEQSIKLSYLGQKQLTKKSRMRKL